MLACDSHTPARPQGEEEGRYWKVEVESQQLRQVKIQLYCTDYQSQHCNLRFHGVLEGQNEDWAAIKPKMTDLIMRELGLPPPLIEGTHLTGKAASPNKPQTAIVRFSNLKDRENVLITSSPNYSETFVVYQDFSSQGTQKRQEIFPKMHDARHQGFRVFTVYDSIEGSQLIPKQLAAPGNRPANQRR